MCRMNFAHVLIKPLLYAWLGGGAGGAPLTLAGGNFAPTPNATCHFFSARMPDDPDVAVTTDATFISASEVRCAAPRAPADTGPHDAALSMPHGGSNPGLATAQARLLRAPVSD